MVKAMVLGLHQLQEDKTIAEDADRAQRGPNRQNWRTTLGHLANKISVIGVCVEKERDILLKLAREKLRQQRRARSEKESEDEVTEAEDAATAGTNNAEAAVSYEDLCRRSSVDAVNCFLHIHNKLTTWNNRDPPTVQRLVEEETPVAIEESTLELLHAWTRTTSRSENLGEIGFNTRLIERLTREASKDSRVSPDISAIDRLMCSTAVHGNEIIREREKQLTEVIGVFQKSIVQPPSSSAQRQRTRHRRAQTRRAEVSPSDGSPKRRRVDS
jgi:hypothetical protein